MDMAEITIEVDDKGNIGTLPDPVQKFLDKKINDAHRRGAESAEEKLRPRLRSEVDEERLKTLEAENSRFKEAELKRKGEQEEAKKLADERHAAELKDREEKLAAKDSEITRRQDRLRSMLKTEVRAAAVAAGARAESLAELEKLLGAELDLDAQTLEPFVKGQDGKPATDKDGKPQTIEGFVTQYLADHPHHFGRTPGKSGRATGGATFHGAVAGDKESALAAAQVNPNAVNVNAAIRSIRKPA
jgi:hypothetical protein